jgi:hypothetical protein
VVEYDLRKRMVTGVAWKLDKDALKREKEKKSRVHRRGTSGGGDILVGLDSSGGPMRPCHSLDRA